MNDFIVHFGIKGQQWGIRRFQNEDGTLTEAGKKRYSSELDDAIKRLESRVEKDATDVYVRAYNRTADQMNNGGIEKFNKDWDKRHKNVKEYDDDLNEQMVEEYERFMSSYLEDNWADEAKKYLKNSKEFKEVKTLIDNYSMTEWNDIAKNFREEYRLGYED